jgi:hypothetical protein
VSGGVSSMEPLRVFRDRFTLVSADGLFELCDVILTAGRVPSPPHLSLVSVLCRGWGQPLRRALQGQPRFGSAQESADILRPRYDGLAGLRG